MPVNNDIDTGVGSAPGVRPSAFSPPAYVNGAQINRPLDTIDSGTATNPAPLFNNVDDVVMILSVPSPGY